jgi:hypothetical protein
VTTRPRGTIEVALLAKGMERDENHHHMFRKTIDGVTHLVTRTSHGMDEVGDSLAKLMARQCCLQLREFWSLVDCTLDEEGWNRLVRQRCAGGRNPFLGR